MYNALHKMNLMADGIINRNVLGKLKMVKDKNLYWWMGVGWWWIWRIWRIWILVVH